LFVSGFARRSIAGLALVALAAGPAAVPVAAQSPAPVISPGPVKKAVKTADDLPRYTYPIDTTATQLVQADPSTFNAFAAKVKANIDSTLAGYDIQDHAALRGLLNTELAIEVLAGEPQSAVQPLADRIKSLEDKPDAKALSGVRLAAMYAAQADAGTTTGPAFAEAFQKRYAAALAALPMSVVGTALKETKTQYDVVSAALVLGQIQGNIDPVVAKTHALSDDLAAAIIGARFVLTDVIPVRAAGSAAIASVLAKNDVQKPDIWAARDVTLTNAQHLTPVNVAVWDSGVDVALYPKNAYVDPKSRNGHGFAFDLVGLPTDGTLYPLPPDKRAIYPQYATYFEGISDLQASIDSPAATAVKQKIASLAAADVPPFLENIQLFGNYAHGTHVAGLAVRGNPAAHIVVGRITFDYKTIPTPPTDTIMHQIGASDVAAVNYFRAHHVRVVNMSWGDSPGDFESVLEKNGIGKDATERKALARHYFEIERDALLSALKSAPEILFVCAAGNENSDSGFGEFIPSMFDLPNLLVVGAVDQAGDETSFTSYGKTVSVNADGYHVPSYVPGGMTVKLSGTSMASPNTANLAAKLIALDPKLTPAQTIALIQKGATPSADGRRHLIDEKASVALLERSMHR
jgi:subtilisin family serine protease